MKQKKTFILFTLLLLARLSFAQTDDAYLGNYAKSSSASSNQEYRVSASLTASGSSLSVFAAVVWQPGVSCEIDLTLDRATVVKTVDPDGHDRYSIVSDFEDGFHNKGSLSLTITGNTCVLSMYATETIDTRATRQYDTYTLTRVNAP